MFHLRQIVKYVSILDEGKFKIEWRIERMLSKSRSVIQV